MRFAARRAVDVAIDDVPGSDVRHDLNGQSTESETLTEEWTEYQCQNAIFPMKNVKSTTISVVPTETGMSGDRTNCQCRRETE
ncbi:hypothetical protein [Brevibacterium sp. VCM10]|uniref:hypothetical protein n=1 Tax=Brevibacterium sp. VCM10 TaxID=1381751 RepID=UPI0012DC8E18|nr:hypothetical protein [Brevibacterium sp. VCM10]